MVLYGRKVGEMHYLFKKKFNNGNFKLVEKKSDILWVSCEKTFREFCLFLLFIYSSNKV